MRDHVTVTPKYAGLFTKEGDPAFIFPKTPDIQQGKSLMTQVSEGIASGELPVGDLALNPREQRGTRRFIKGKFTPRKVHGLTGFTHPWGEKVLEAVAEGEEFAVELATQHPRGLFAWKELFSDSDIPMHWLQGKAGIDVSYANRTTYLTNGNEYNVKRATPEWRNYFGFMSGVATRLRDIHDQFITLAPVRNPALDHLGIADFTKDPTAEQLAGIRRYLEVAEKVAYLHSYGESRTPVLSAGSMRPLSADLAGLIEWLFRDHRTRQALIWNQNTTKKWRDFAWRTMLSLNDIDHTKDKFDAVADKLAVYDSAQRLQALAVISGIGDFVLGSRTVAENIYDSEKTDQDIKQQAQYELDRVTAAKKEGFWEGDKHWQTFNSKYSSTKSVLKDLKELYTIQNSEGKQEVQVPQDPAESAGRLMMFMTNPNSPQRAIDRLAVMLRKIPKLYEDPNDRVGQIHGVLKEHSLYRHEWQKLEISNEVDQELIIAKMVLSEAELAAYLQKVQDRNLDDMIRSIKFRNTRAEVFRYITEELGWTDLYSTEGKSDLSAFTSDQPFWRSDRDKEMYARSNWELEKFRRFALHYGFFPEDQASLFNVACEMLKH